MRKGRESTWREFQSAQTPSILVLNKYFMPSVSVTGIVGHVVGMMLLGCKLCKGYDKLWTTDDEEVEPATKNSRSRTEHKTWHGRRKCARRSSRRLSHAYYRIICATCFFSHVCSLSKCDCEMLLKSQIRAPYHLRLAGRR